MTRRASTPSARARGDPPAEARLALLEALEDAVDVEECARRGVGWLADRTAIARVLCAALEPATGRLRGVAGHGIDPHHVAGFVLDRAADGLVARAMDAGDAVRLSPAEARGASAAASRVAGESGCVLVALHDDGAPGGCVGALLVSAPSASVLGALGWCARRLAVALARRLARVEAAHRFERERAALQAETARLEAQRREFEQAAALKTQFLASVSHEIRTPLNAILGYTSMLLQGMAEPLQEKQERMLTKVDSNGRHLLALINDVLDIARLDAGKLPLHVLDFRVGDLLAEVTSEIEPLVARAGLALATDVGPDVTVIRSDRRKIKQILLNLLSNAIKFTPRGSIRVSCQRAAGGRAAITVADTGVGIAEADHAKVFEDFGQVVPGQHGGTGLGLAICRRLAAVLGGRLVLESRLGSGATFTLLLPLAGVADPAAAAVADLARRSAEDATTA